MDEFVIGEPVRIVDAHEQHAGKIGFVRRIQYDACDDIERIGVELTRKNGKTKLVEFDATAVQGFGSLVNKLETQKALAEGYRASLDAKEKVRVKEVVRWIETGYLPLAELRPYIEYPQVEISTPEPYYDRLLSGVQMMTPVVGPITETMTIRILGGMDHEIFLAIGRALTR